LEFYQGLVLKVILSLAKVIILEIFSASLIEEDASRNWYL